MDYEASRNISKNKNAQKRRKKQEKRKEIFIIYYLYG
jgi:hypothetical protein